MEIEESTVVPAGGGEAPEIALDGFEMKGREALNRPCGLECCHYQ